MIGVIIIRLSLFINRLSRMYNAYEKLMIMYVPFISSLSYCISIYLFINGLSTELYSRYNNNFCGHSIFWLQVVLSRSKNMCVWYKSSIIASMVSHVFNLIHYHGFIKYSLFLNGTLAAAIVSILCWLIFKITYKTTKVVHSACTRLEELEKSQSHTSS